MVRQLIVGKSQCKKGSMMREVCAPENESLAEKKIQISQRPTGSHELKKLPPDFATAHFSWTTPDHNASSPHCKASVSDASRRG